MKRKDGFTITETIVVTAIMVVIVSIAAQTHRAGGMGFHRVIRRAHDNELLLMLMNVWQKALAGTSSEAWKPEGAAFNAGNVTFLVADDLLTVERNGRKKYVQLPSGSECSFFVESGGDTAPRAVMQIEWQVRYAHNNRSESARFVACGGQE